MAMSYAEVRDLVSDQLGTCGITTEELEANLLGVLDDVKNRIGNVISKNTKDSLSVQKGLYAYAVPATIERITSISNNAGHELYRVAYPCSYCIDNTETGNPTSWHMDVNEIVLHPIPVANEVFILRGTKTRDQVLYEPSVQGKTTIVYGLVDESSFLEARDDYVDKLKAGGWTIDGKDQESVEAEAQFSKASPLQTGTIKVQPLCKGYVTIRYKLNQ